MTVAHRRPVAINVVEIGTVGGIYEDGSATNATKGPHRAIDPTGQEFLRFLEKFMRTGQPKVTAHLPYLHRITHRTMLQLLPIFRATVAPHR